MATGNDPGAPPSRPGAPTGRITLIATPIGNLGDLSPRAVTELSRADVIACEDTRVTRRLLSYAGITGRRLVALHARNEATAAPALVAQAVAGSAVAVVTDAGTPGISDPGARLVSEAASAGLDVVVVPGPSAVVAALALSGMPADRFAFEGFLPRSGGERSARLDALASERRTVVLYESPHRVRATLRDLASVCGHGRPVAVARELTKLHEQVWRGSLGAAADWLNQVEPRGEYVLVVGAAPAPSRAARAEVIDAATIETALLSRLRDGDDRKAAVAAVAMALGVPKRQVYDAAVRLRTESGDRVD